VFYDAQHVLSVIAKFLVHLLGEGKRCGEMGQRTQAEQWGGKEENMEGQELAIH